MNAYKKLSVVLLFAVFCLPLSAEEIELSAPASSEDGSYVLRLNADDSAYQSQQQGKQLEVYRNKDGGEYRRILVGPRFSALSELVRENGVYGYKARWVRIVDEKPIAEFSQEVFVKVTTAIPRMVAPRNDKIVSSMSAVRSTLN